MAPDTANRLNAALEGRYRIERQLGEGGMATVYLADDIKHERKVALKVLKPELAAVVGAERFLAEIKTTANLQHPHILPLFDSGEADSFLFYVMPYVEGESLRERLDREHQLPVDEAVRIASDVAEALQAAHDHGVIHRDVKPANILLSKGRPLVSDFGIALALGAAGAGRLTETGLSLGTPHYMSPEQATGDLSVGAATDVYALGCVLYEMLVGEPPYTGSTPQAVLGKIVTGDADPVRKHRRSVPTQVDATIRKALEKVPADRFRQAEYFARALGDPGFRHGDTAVAASGGQDLWKPFALGLVALSTVLAVVAGRALRSPDPVQPVYRFELAHSFEAQPIGLAVSRDGQKVAVPGLSTDGVTQLFVRNLNQLNATPVPGTDGATNYARFSPDGESIAFIAEGSLKRVTLSGGDLITLVNDSVQSAQAGLDWAEDGMIYFRKSGLGVWRVPEGGGEEEEVTSLSDGATDHAWFDVLPGGKAMLFTVHDPPPSSYRTAAKSLETGEVHNVLVSQSAGWDDNAACLAKYARSGHIVYVTCAGALLAAPFDAERLEMTGPSRTLLQGVRMTQTGFGDFVMSNSGTLVYRGGEAGDRALAGTAVWVSSNGAAQVLDPAFSGVIEVPALSPDGRKVAFDRTDGERTDVWVYDLEAGTLSRLTDGGTYNARPDWSPDGSEVGYITDRDGGLAFYARPWDRSGPARLIRSPGPGAIIQEALWTPDSRWLVYREVRTNADQDLLYSAPHPDSAAHVLVDDPTNNSQLSLSPNGRWLAHRSNQSGQSEVYVRAFPGPGAVTAVSAGGGRSPLWSRDGRQLFYVSTADDVWMVANVRTEPDFRIESREPFASVQGFADTGNIQRFDVAPDGQKLLAVRYLTNTEPRDIVVLNFFEELNRLVPAN